MAGSSSHNCKCQSQDWNPGPNQTPGFMGLTTVLPWLPLASPHSLFWVVLKTRLNWPISQGCPLARWGCLIRSVGLCGKGSWQRRDSYRPLPFSSRFSNSPLQIQPRSRPARPDRPPCLPGTLVITPSACREAAPPETHGPSPGSTSLPGPRGGAGFFSPGCPGQQAGRGR